MYGLHKLLWELRKHPELAERYRAEPDAVLAGYELADEERDALVRGDFKALYDRGVNPYLLYFFALQLGVDRTAYYASVRGENRG
jgi:hypothetical protein